MEFWPRQPGTPDVRARLGFHPAPPPEPRRAVIPSGFQGPPANPFLVCWGGGVPGKPGVPNEAGLASLGWKPAFGLLGGAARNPGSPRARPKIPRSPFDFAQGSSSRCSASADPRAPPRDDSCLESSRRGLKPRPFKTVLPRYSARPADKASREAATFGLAPGVSPG